MNTPIESLKKVQIQERLRENGLPVSGDKKTLLGRLLGVIHAPNEEEMSSGSTPIVNDHDEEEIFSDTLDHDSVPEVSNARFEGAAGGVRGATVVSPETPVSVRDLEIFRKDMLDSISTLIRAALQAPSSAPSSNATNLPTNRLTVGESPSRAPGSSGQSSEAHQIEHQNPNEFPLTTVSTQLDRPTIAQAQAQSIVSAQLFLHPNESHTSSLITRTQLDDPIPPATDPFQMDLVSNVLANSSSSTNQEIPNRAAGTSQNQEFTSQNLTNVFAPVPQYNRVAVQHAAENMPEFDPYSEFGKTKSAKIFLQKLRKLQEHFGYSDFILLEAAQQKLRGEAKRWNEESPEIYKTFAEFETDLLATYPACMTKADVMEEIFTMKRAPTEGLEAFCHRMIIVGRRAQLPDMDVAQYILKRIDHTQFLTAVACVPINSTTDLIRAVSSFVQKMPTERAAAPVRPNILKTTAASPASISEQRPNTTVEKRCWNCRGSGHTLNKCPQPQMKCTNCQRFGHLAPQCRSEKRPARVFRIDGDDGGGEDGVNFEKLVTVNGQSFQAYIDGGTRWSLIAQTVAVSLGGIQQLEQPVSAKGFAGEPVTCKTKITLQVIVDKQQYCGDLHVVDDEYLEPSQLLLGTDLLCGVGRFILIGNNKCRLLPSLAEAAESHRSHVEELLQQFQNCFSDNLTNIGVARTTSMNIELTKNEPIYQRGCRIPFAQRPIVSEMIQDLLASGIIEHSNSPYASQIVMVKKSSGEDRMCVDYRPLNAVTIKHQFPMPIIEELFTKLAGNRYFTTLDFMSGYYQIPVHEESRKYTAFDTHEGHYQFTRMPFGLVNAPSVFQACMNNLVKNVPTGEAIAYLDDVVIPSATIEEGVNRLRRFLIAVQEAGLTLRMSKCVFLAERIKFLGHNVSEDGINPGDDKVLAIRNFPQPTNIHEVRRFLGLTGFFRKFVPNYSSISKPITELTKTVNSPPFNWSDEHTAAFETLKERLCCEPVLCLYDPAKFHEVHTDASSTGLAGVLMQLESDGKLHPCFYYSRHCTFAEQKYHSFELETLAIVEFLEKYRVCLVGQHFRIVTDCAAVTTTKNTKPMIPRIARWWLKLQEFDYELVHRPGLQLAYVDAMSRAPVEPAKEAVDVTERVMRIDITTDDWVVTMQLQDDKLRHIVEVLRGSETTNESKQLHTDYVLKGNRLYRKCNDGHRWVVPNAVRWRVVKSAHDDRGHFGAEKTLGYLRKEFWFAGMRDYVKKYLQACIACSMNKKSGGATEGQLHISKTVPTPFMTIHIDHLGPFPKSTKGNAYVIAVVDSFSKYVIVKAARTTDSRAVLNMLSEMSTYFGLPTRIVSDRGTAFTSKQFSEYCTTNAIQHIKNAVRTPRANGQVERVNQMIAMFLRTTHEDDRKWDVDLRGFQWIVNSQINKTTGCCPNEIIFRYRLRAQGENQLLAALHETDEDDEHHPLPPLEDVARAMDLAKLKWKQRFDRRHKSPTKYEEQDLVLVEHIPPATGQSRKLEPRYKGPYVIKKVLGCDRYLVGDLSDIQRTQKPFESVFTSEKLKLWCSLGPEANEEDDDIDEDIHSHAEPTNEK